MKHHMSFYNFSRHHDVAPVPEVVEDMKVCLKMLGFVCCVTFLSLVCSLFLFLTSLLSWSKCLSVLLKPFIANLGAGTRRDYLSLQCYVHVAFSTYVKYIFLPDSLGNVFKLTCSHCLIMVFAVLSFYFITSICGYFLHCFG